MTINELKTYLYDEGGCLKADIDFREDIFTIQECLIDNGYIEFDENGLVFTKDSYTAADVKLLFYINTWFSYLIDNISEPSITDQFI